MTEFFSRDQWGARNPKPGPGALNVNEVRGIALHWPGMSGPLQGVNRVSAALRSWQAYHMDDRGWSDLAYQQIVDQDGNRYQGRGLSVTSGANGDEFTNDVYGAVLLVLAPGEPPSAAMVRTVRTVITRHRAAFPNSRRIVGHGQIRPGGTDCPGAMVQKYIDSGKFEPRPPWTPVVLRRRVTRALAEAEAAPDRTPGIEATRRRLRRILYRLEGGK